MSSTRSIVGLQQFSWGLPKNDVRHADTFSIMNMCKMVGEGCFYASLELAKVGVRVGQRLESRRSIPGVVRAWTSKVAADGPGER